MTAGPCGGPGGTEPRTRQSRPAASSAPPRMLHCPRISRFRCSVNAATQGAPTPSPGSLPWLPRPPTSCASSSRTRQSTRRSWRLSRRPCPWTWRARSELLGCRATRWHNCECDSRRPSARARAPPGLTACTDKHPFVATGGAGLPPGGGALPGAGGTSRRESLRVIRRPGQAWPLRPERAPAVTTTQENASPGRCSARGH